MEWLGGGWGGGLAAPSWFSWSISILFFIVVFLIFEYFFDFVSNLFFVYALGVRDVFDF